MEKTCTKCKQEKSLDDFNSHKQTVDQKQSWCKKCIGIDAKKRHMASPEKQKLANLKFRHKMGGVDYDAVLNAQGGVCAICKRPPIKKRLAVDHDHATSKNRGLLCFSCNTALGMFKDNPVVLGAAIAYLKQYSS